MGGGGRRGISAEYSTEKTVFKETRLFLSMFFPRVFLPSSSLGAIFFLCLSVGAKPIFIHPSPAEEEEEEETPPRGRSKRKEKDGHKGTDRKEEGKKSWIRMQMIDPSAHSPPPLLILVETNPLIHAGEIEDIRVGSGRKTLQRLCFMFLGGVPPNLPRCPTLCVFSFSVSNLVILPLSAITEIGGERETLLPPQNCFLLALPFFWPTQKAANYSGTSHLVQGVD